MLLLINKSTLMGKYVNSRFINSVAWITALILIAITGIYILMPK
jgi:Mn2+/Fe2+ NRAMP family transporter